METRSLEDVERLADHAKLGKSDLHPAAQSIYFSPSLNATDFKLLEVDQQMLDSLVNGESLVIRGLESDGSFLCTKTQTFEMKEAETSNTFLLLSNCASHDELSSNGASVTVQKVEAMRRSYFELKPVKPRLKRLQECLEENLYDGNICDIDSNEEIKMYTFEDLLDKIQSSEEELRCGLNQINACLIDGYWRLLDGGYKNQLINSIMAVINEHSWTIDYIPWNDLCEKLIDLYPVAVVRYMLELLGTAGTTADGVVFYKLKDDAVGRYFAEMILSSARQFNLREFVETWQMAVPEGIKTDLQQLEGMVLIDQDSRPATICYFPASELPENIDERFQLLFSNKTRWTREEITPYLEAICLDKQSIGILLNKHARVSSQKGTKLYSSKKLK